MNLEVKHFEMLIDVINKLLEQTYYVLSRIKYYDDLKDEVDNNIKSIIYPMLCDISKQTGLTISMLRNKWWWNYYDLYYKQITPNTPPDKFWSECSDDDDEK